MRTKFSGMLTLLLAFAVQLTFAQQKTVSGTVLDETNLPLPGVNVIAKGTTNGVQTDFDGNYTIEVSVGETLVFSYVGYKNVEMPVTAASSDMSFSMELDASVLNEVVVTGFAVKKEKKALGYSVSSIQQESIQESPQTDLTRVLTGKAAGINITTQNGMSGSANKVVIRGTNSFTGDNNALYVIDGVPISNDTNQAGNFVDGNMGSSRSFDIDPNNIERVDILKGLAATTLYGTQGRNGVILITTKSGSGAERNAKQEIEVSSSLFVNEVSILPDYQNKYGGGFDQAFGWFYSNWGPGFYRDGLGGWGSDPSFDSNGTVAHPYSTSNFLATNYPDYQAQFAGERYDWKPRNSVNEFFRKGLARNISVNARGRSADGKFGYGTVFSNLDEDGFTPGNNVKRTNLTLSGDAKLSNKFSIRGSMTYTKTDLKTPPVAASFGSSTFGSGSSIFGDLFYTPRSIDFYELPFELPDGGSVYYRQDNAIQHPLWTVKNARFSQLVNRVNGFANISYDISDKFNVFYQASIDNYTENAVNRQNRGGVTGDINTDRGFYQTTATTNTIYDHRIVFSGNNFSFLDDKANMSFTLGATSNSIDYNSFGLRSTDQQVFGFFDHSGYTERFQSEFHQRRNIVGVFGQMLLDYDNYLFVNLSGRNDWVSNSIENSLFYPSASVSFVPTSAFEGLSSDTGIKYLKLRAGYGTSANFVTGYPTVTLVSLNPQAWNDGGSDVTSNTTTSTIGNRAIRPELFEEIEFGAEGNLFGRLTFDVSVFERTTNDLIVENQPIPTSTGASFIDNNIGEVQSKGVEADLGLNIIKAAGDGFDWKFNVNYTTFESEVISLGQDTEQVVYAGFTNLGNFATVGDPLGAMYGSRVARDANGNLLVDAAGNYIPETTTEDGLVPKIGDANPDYVMNFLTTMTYKGLTLNAQFTHVSGGDIYSTYVGSLLGRGLTTDTEDRLGTYILDGVSADTGLPNNVQINNSDFYFSNGFASPADELQVYDASVVRLQELSLGYSLSSKLLEKTPFGSVTFKFSGFNLWYDAYNTPEGINFDPNVSGLGAGNGAGFDFLTGPSSKRYGFSVNATF